MYIYTNIITRINVIMCYFLINQETYSYNCKYTQYKYSYNYIITIVKHTYTYKYSYNCKYTLV